MDLAKRTTILITCGPEQVDVLAREVEALGMPVESSHRSSVTVRGGLDHAMRLNLNLRTAFSVLLLLHEFRARTPERLYNKINALPWEALIAANEMLTIDCRVDTAAINNTMFVNQRVKDAICDRIASATGSRPDSGPDRSGVVLTLYWKKDHVRLYLNTSGRRLSDRGYRLEGGSAPMMETLAAAVLLTLGYDGSQLLVNPMCGSGTIAIEAALIARGIAPGLLRDDYSFMHVRSAPNEAWEHMRSEAAALVRDRISQPIVASDSDPDVINIARRNADRAGVGEDIEFHVCDFADTPLPGEPGIIVMNPEYGRRLGEQDGLRPVYARMGDWFKQQAAGWIAGVFTGNLDLAKSIGLRTSRRTPFYNADIECRLLTYELYEGSRREPQTDATGSRG